MGMQPPPRPRHRGSSKTVLSGNVVDRNLPGRAHNYIPQCGLASLSLSLILLVEHALIGVAIVFAVASTAFTILFTQTASHPPLGESWVGTLLPCCRAQRWPRYS